MIKLAILASGSGSNAQRIIEYFSANKDICFPYIICNNEDAFVRERAKKLGVKSIYLSKNEITQTDSLLNLLKENQIDWVILAGFLLLIPPSVIL